MGDIFLKLLNMSIAAGWFILAVLCIRLIFRKIPKWVNCLLWGAVAVRLICPFSIESQFSILPSAELIKSSAIVEGEVQNDIPSIDSRLTIVKNTINPMLAETFSYDESESAAPLQVVTYTAGMIWVCGMVLLIIGAAAGMIRLHKLVEEAVCVRDIIYICDAVRSPFILGIARPRVYLSSALGEKEMDYIIAHESAHLRRKDHWWKPLGYLLLCIYWFHPLCWAAYAVFCRDIELACDEKAAKDMTFHEKKEYAEVLLACTVQRSLVMACPLAFGEVGVKERVKSVLSYKKPAFWVAPISILACAAAAVCFLTTSPETRAIKAAIPAAEEEMNAQEEEIIFDREAEEALLKKASIQDSLLYEQPEAGKVCIKVQPSMIREQNYYYYIPIGEDQEWLSRQVEALDLEGEPWDRRWEGHRERGWQIIYNDVEIRAFEGGYLYCTYDDEGEMMECFIEAPKLCDYIQIMLLEKLGYHNYNTSNIKDIVSAELKVQAAVTGGKYYSQTITDAETLQKFEEWFRDAEYILPGTDCGYRHACLKLTLANGNIVELSMATDSCPNFSMWGVAYDYSPAPDWDSSEFFKCFDEIPWEFRRL